MIKTIYAQIANEGLTRQQFAHIWRGHGALAMGLSNFWDPVVRYIHSDRVNDASAFSDIDERYVAVGEIQYADREARLKSRAAPELPSIMLPDASRAFDRRYSIEAGVEEVFLRPGRHAPVKLYHFLWRSSARETARAFDEWEKAQRDFLSASPVGRFVRNAVSGRSVDETFKVSGSLEFGFDTVEDSAAFQREWSVAMKEGARQRFDLERIVTVPTFVALFHDMRFTID